jgi:4a-hydroxytetrahydrobiopterin dehydratase
MANWINENNALHKTFTFADFESAMHFMQLAAKSIAIQNHHPEWTNVYNKVAVKLTTHDAANTITEKDEMLAVEFDKIYNSIAGEAA